MISSHSLLVRFVFSLGLISFVVVTLLMLNTLSPISVPSYVNYSLYSFQTNTFESDNPTCSSLNTEAACNLWSSSCAPLVGSACDFTSPTFIGCYDKKDVPYIRKDKPYTTQCMRNQNKTYITYDDHKEYLPSGWTREDDCSSCKPSQPHVSLLALYWKEEDSMKHSLKTWSNTGLLDLATERIVYIQEVTPKKIEIFAPYNFTIIGSQTNENIAHGIDTLVKAANSEYLLFLEKDWAIFESPQKVRYEIGSGVALMRDRGFQHVKYRSRRNRGNPSRAHQLQGREDEHLKNSPTMMCNFYVFIENIEQRWPDQMKKCEGFPGFYCVDSHDCNWTNNPSMFPKSFWMENLSKYVDVVGRNNRNMHSWEVFTKDTPSVWRDRHYKVALGDGLFTHHEINEC